MPEIPKKWLNPEIIVVIIPINGFDVPKLTPEEVKTQLQYQSLIAFRNWLGPKKLQAKHIKDRDFIRLTLEAERRTAGLGASWTRPEDYATLMMPEKVVLAKARALLKRGLIAGCGCGCRGDFRVTPAGWAALLDRT
jgi:hypothetical protein